MLHTERDQWFTHLYDCSLGALSDPPKRKRHDNNAEVHLSAFVDVCTKVYFPTFVCREPILIVGKLNQIKGRRRTGVSVLSVHVQHRIL